MSDTIAEMRLPTQDLRDDMPFYTGVLKMRLDMIYPIDDPRIGVFSGHGLRLRVEKGAAEPPGTLGILTDDPDAVADRERRLMAPNGTRIEIEARNPPLVLSETQRSFAVRRLADQALWIVGRAGMHCRDLAPDRLGGSIIASHIRIPDGGPVPDMVHFRRVGLQLIFCIHGWVDVLYEDQGGLLREAVDCIIQPPEIRHKVMEASGDLQVIEIGVPADHVTEIAHDMTLHTPQLRPERFWQGQRFVHNLAADATWQPFRLPGYQARDTTIAGSTGNVAGVQVVRRGVGTPVWSRHDADILFAFVVEGHATLEGEARDAFALQAGDAFVVPPEMRTRLSAASDDLEFLEVTLPGVFNTELEPE